MGRGGARSPAHAPMPGELPVTSALRACRTLGQLSRALAFGRAIGMLDLSGDIAPDLVALDVTLPFQLLCFLADRLDRGCAIACLTKSRVHRNGLGQSNPHDFPRN